MEEFRVIHTALRNWRRVEDAREYQDVTFQHDSEHILDSLEWPVPPFQEFFDWVLNQPGTSLPHLSLEGRVPVRYAEDLESESEDEDEVSEDEEVLENSQQYAPALTVFAHSDKFDKEYMPAHGVSVRTHDNLGISEMRTVIAKFKSFISKHSDMREIHLNLLVYCNVTSPSEKLLQKFFARYKGRHQLVTTIFSMQKDLHWFKLDHQLVLPHRILSRKQVENELKKEAIDVKRLPQLRTSDPVAQILALSPGMIVRIDVPLDSLEDHIYRLVVESCDDAETEEYVNEDAHEEST